MHFFKLGPIVQVKGTAFREFSANQFYSRGYLILAPE